METTHSPEQVLENSFSQVSARPHPTSNGGLSPLQPPITVPPRLVLCHFPSQIRYVNIFVFLKLHRPCCFEISPLQTPHQFFTVILTSGCLHHLGSLKTAPVTSRKTGRVPFSIPPTKCNSTLNIIYNTNVRRLPGGEKKADRPGGTHSVRSLALPFASHTPGRELKNLGSGQALTKSTKPAVRHL